MIWYVEEERRQGQHDSAFVPEFFKVREGTSGTFFDHKNSGDQNHSYTFLGKLGGIGFGT